MKRCVLFTAFLSLLPSISVSLETADRILEKAFKAQLSNGFQAEIDLETTGSTSGKSHMRISVLGKIDRNNSRLVIFFHEPAGSRGMKLLSVIKRGNDPLLFIYMPEVHQSFQLNGEDLNMRLGDSVATLGDLVSMVPWDGTHTLLGTETCVQESCFIIETRRAWEEGKRITRIGNKSLLSHSMEQFDDHDRLVKKIETLETRKIGEKNCVTTLKITSYRDKGIVTILKLLSGNMDLAVPDTIFKPSMLKYSYTELMRLGEDVL